MKYEPGIHEHPSVTKGAIAAACRVTPLWKPADVSTIVLAFLEHMAENYVGDYYVEGSLDHLVTMVTEASA